MEYMADAIALRGAYIGPVDLDNAIPFDIYELFATITNRDYSGSRADESLILDIANAYETGK